MSAVVKGAVISVGVTNPTTQSNAVVRDGIIKASVSHAVYPSRVLIGVGVKGDKGLTGESTDGNTVLSGWYSPNVNTGVEGDFFIDLRYNTIYGPRVEDSWGSPTALIGPPGETGPEGPAGPAVPVGMEFMGEWDTIITYFAGQMVMYLGEPYFALRNNTGHVPTDVPESWSIMYLVGPEGPEGPEGPAGATGADGLIGLTGETGPTGPQGVQGVQGVEGIQGPEGPEGPQGVDGIQGVTGLQGDDGAVGPTGPEGVQGIQGIQGDPGIQGEQGDVGPAILNYQGEWDVATAYVENDWVTYLNTAYFCILADTGTAPGTDDTVWILLTVSGPTGPEGPQGIQGIQGETGVAGPTGPIGPTGPQGVEGPQGEDGPQGLQGEDGPVGPLGPEGPEGPEGPIGETGVSGPAGAGALTARLPSAIDAVETELRITTNYEWPTIPESGISTYNVLLDNELMVVTNSVRVSATEVLMTVTRGAFSTSATNHKKNGVVALRPYGTAGAIGADGADGEIGPQGIQGIPGEQGPIGPEGPEGPEGIQGIQGEDGPQGIPGEAGTSAFDVHVFYPGTISVNDTVLLSVPLADNVSFASNFTGSYANVEDVATADTVFSIRKNGVECGTITFAVASTTGVFASTSGLPVAFVSSDKLSLYCEVKDVSLADMGLVLAGIRQ